MNIACGAPDQSFGAAKYSAAARLALGCGRNITKELDFMKKFVRALALALAVLMIAALAGCAKTPASSAAPASQAPSSAAPAASQQPEKDYKDTKFTIAWWGSDSRHTATTQLIEEFEKDYKNLKIDVEYFSWGDYWTKMTTHAAAKDLPDVIQMDYAKIMNYVDGNLLMELDAMIADKRIDLTDVSEGAVSAGKINGKMYAIVTGVNSPVYVYNPEIAKKAGVTISETPTLDEFTKACETVYDKTGAMMVEYMLDTDFPRLYGKNLWSDDGKSCGFSEEDFVDYLTRRIEATEHGYLPNPKTDTEGEWIQKMSTDTFWVCPGFTTSLEKFCKETGKELKMFALPSTDKCKAPVYEKANQLWAIAASSEEADIAAAFLNTYTNDIRTFEICGLDRGLPISSKLREEIADKLTPAQKIYANFQTMLEDGHVSDIYPPEPSKADEAHAALAELYEQIKYGQVNKSNVAEKAKECMAKINNILKAE